MEVRLVIEKGKSHKRVVRMPSVETIVGRRQDCDLRIPSAEVSRRHCLLTFYDGCLSVEDLDSVNGTFINGRRVTGKQVIYPGDHLEIGPLSFVVEYEMTQSVLDRLRPPVRKRTDEQLDVLPLAAEEGLTLAPSEGALDALPLLEEDTELALSQSADDLPTAEADEADEAIPVAEDLVDNADWHLPQNNDLRDLLSGMDDRKSRGRREED